ncbi:hypothetical protein, partial [Streptococcus uberis]
MNYVINLCHLQNNEGIQSFQLVLLQHQAEFQNFSNLCGKVEQRDKNSVVQEMPKGACTSACVSSLINL